MEILLPDKILSDLLDLSNLTQDERKNVLKGSCVLSLLVYSDSESSYNIYNILYSYSSSSYPKRSCLDQTKKTKLKLRTSAKTQKKTLRENIKSGLSASNSPVTVTKSPVVPKTVETFITYWNESRKGGGHTDTTTKVFKNAVLRVKKLIRGIMFDDAPELSEYAGRKFDLEEFKRAVDHFKLMAYNPAYKPTDESFKQTLQRINLPSFIYDPRFSTFNSSLFLFCLDNPPEPVETTHLNVENNFPELTELLIKIFRNEVIGNKDWKPLMPFRIKFIRAANRLKEYVAENQSRLPKTGDLQMANWLVKSVLEDTQDKTLIHPGYLATDETFTRRLPMFLKNKGLLNEQRKVVVKGDLL